MPRSKPYDSSRLLPPGAIYKALGTSETKGCERRYVILVQGELRAYRGAEMHGLAFLFDLYPDAAHWRALWPAGGKTQIEARAACADIMKECNAAGNYDLPDDLRSKPGNPNWRKAKLPVNPLD